MPSLTSFTYLEIADDAAGVAGTGVVYYAGGYPPLVLDEDVPAILSAAHLGLVGYACAMLASGYLADDGENQSRVENGLAMFTDAVKIANARLF